MVHINSRPPFSNRKGFVITLIAYPFDGGRKNKAIRNVRCRTMPKIVATYSTRKPKIGVIGGGVLGLTAALKIMEDLDADLHLFCENLITDTTSIGAAGLWKPYAVSKSDSEVVNRWGKITFDHYRSIYLSDQAKNAGVFLTGAYELFTTLEPDPDWAHITPGFRHLTVDELEFYDPTSQHVDGIAYDTFIAEGRLYMTWILEKLQNLGTKIVKQRIESIPSLAKSHPELDIIVNCTGLGARELVNDDAMHGIRGHVIRVKAPWIQHHIESHGIESSLPAYIIPNTDSVVLGGTKEIGGREDTVPRPEDRDAILRRCVDIVPSLEGAEIMGEWVGLRPGRNSIRLELETMALDDGMSIPVVHSYGHGGSGLTLAWGCATDVSMLVKEYLSL